MAPAAFARRGSRAPVGVMGAGGLAVLLASLPAAARPPREGASPAPADHPGDAIAAPRKVRPETWVEDSRYHDGLGPERVQVTAARADLLARPNAAGNVIGAARRGEILPVVRLSRDDRWYLVELGGGEVAWIAAPAVKPVAGRAPPSRPPPPSVPDPSDAPASGPPRPAASSAGRTAPPVVAAPPPGDEARAPGEGAPRPGRKQRRKNGTQARDSAPDATPDEPLAEVTVTRAPERPPSDRFFLGARGGVAFLGQRFTSNATGFLTNYEASATAFAAELEAGFRLPVGLHLILGLDGGYRFAGATGFRVDVPAAGSTGAGPVVLALQAHDANAVGTIGARFDALGGLSLQLLFGGALRADLVQLDPQALLPSDRLIAMMVGARIQVPSLVAGLGIRAEAALLAPGSLAQTGGLGEGQADSPIGVAVAATLGYRFAAGVGLDLGLRYGAARTAMHGTAERNTAITDAQRTSSALQLAFGLSFAR